MKSTEARPRFPTETRSLHPGVQERSTPFRRQFRRQRSFELTRHIQQRRSQPSPDVGMLWFPRQIVPLVRVVFVIVEFFFPRVPKGTIDRDFFTMLFPNLGELFTIQLDVLQPA
jgi:hypothetical protein